MHIGIAMTDRYHYDANGNYTGKTSDTPPSSGIGGAIVLIIILIALFKGCSGSDSTPTQPNSQSNTQPSSQSNTQSVSAPQQSIQSQPEPPLEQKQKWIIKD